VVEGSDLFKAFTTEVPWAPEHTYLPTISLGLVTWMRVTLTGP
jgi:hypothetical protein